MEQEPAPAAPTDLVKDGGGFHEWQVASRCCGAGASQQCSACLPACMCGARLLNGGTAKGASDCGGDGQVKKEHKEGRYKQPQQSSHQARGPAMPPGPGGRPDNGPPQKMQRTGP